MLKRYADSLLSANGELQTGGAPWWRTIRNYRWATLALPWEVLLLAVAQTTPTELRRPDLLSAIGPLSRRWSENHLHQGGAAEYSELWTGLMLDAYQGTLSLASMPEDKAIPMGSPTGVERLLYQAAAVRMRLVGFNHKPASVGERRAWNALDATWLGATRQPLGDYRLLSRGVRVHRRGGCPTDPASVALGQPSPSAECEVLHKALHSSCVYSLQYLRVYCWLYRYVVQQPGVQGLGWFDRHYRRLDTLTKGIEDHRQRRALRLTESHLRAQHVETRSTPRRALRKILETHRLAHEVGTRVRFAVHFLRADSRKTPWHRDWLEENRGSATTVARLIRRPGPSFSAVDCANDELSVPTGIENAVLHCALASASRSRHPPALSLHAGEDYRSPLEGLRRVDRVLMLASHYGLRARIGHGLALLESRERSREGRLLQPRFERLCDLRWEEHLAWDMRIRRGDGRKRAVEHEMRLLLDEMELGSTPLPQARVLLDRFTSPDETFALHGRKPYRYEDPLSQFLGNRRKTLLGQQPVEVVWNSSEREVSQAARDAVRRKAIDMGAFIECCPSSNLLVGDYNALEDHPMYLEENEQLKLTINSDDPLTFATCLADEIAYALAGAIASGMTLPEALTWIDRLRRNGNAVP